LGRIFAQDSAQDSTPPPAPNGRIVEERPPLYSFKREAHPLTWVEWGAEPMFRSADSGFLQGLIARRGAPEKPAGIKFDLGGAGAGSGFGPEVTLFNKNFLGRGIDVEVPLLYTYKRYELYRFAASVPLLHGSSVKKGLTFDLGTAYSSRTRENMFPIGNDAPLAAESQVRIVSRNLAAGFSAHVNDRLKVGLHETYRNVGVTRPLWGTSAQDRLRDFGIPGLLTGGTILSTVIALDHDRQEQTEVITRNNIEHLEVSFNQSAGNGDFAYWKYHLEAQHFFPLRSDQRTAIALRAFAEANQRRSGGDIPFFDMPALGTWETLRGFENFRFRDRSALSLTAEYRYRIWRYMDWAFFLDEGQVAPRPRDFGWDRFHPGYGFRWFAYPKPSFPIAIDFSRSAEKNLRLYINFNTTF
jgi:hypothetical protein